MRVGRRRGRTTGRRRGVTARLAAVLVTVGVVGGVVPSEQVAAQETSFAIDLLTNVAEGAAGQAGSDLFGWVLGSAGSTDQDLAVLNQILDELDTIESTLEGIENEIAELINALDQLDCDTWVQNALPMVNAISNLWDPDSASAGGPGAPPAEQSYVGILAETQDNTVTVADMEAWVDQVLNNNGQGINDLSILQYLQDLGNVLIPPAGGSGLIQSCLAVPSNGPSNYIGQIDDAYYNAVVDALIGYYYAIQTQGVTMVVEALNFEAWQAAGSPTSTTANIEDIAERICGNPTGDVKQLCDNAQWAVYGTDGVTGVRGRIAEQLTLGGAPYTSLGLLGQELVHRYVSSTVVFASSPELFSSQNSTDGCTALVSSAPCGILRGVYDTNTTLGGTYGLYGEGLEGTWRAADGDDFNDIFTHAPSWGTAYANVGAYMMQERGFVDLPSNTIFLASGFFFDQPYGSGHGGIDVITFTDTGVKPPLAPFFGTPTYTSYFNYSNALLVRTDHNSSCDLFNPNPALPAASENGSYYIGQAEFCYDGSKMELYEWKATGWGNPANKPQFRMPVIDITTLTCNTGLKATNPGGAYTRCGDDFTAWLSNQVPPALTDTEAALDCEIHSPPGDLDPGGPDLPYDRTAIWTGDGELTKCNDVAADEGSITPPPPTDVMPPQPGTPILPPTGSSSLTQTLAVIALGLIASGGIALAAGRRR